MKDYIFDVMKPLLLKHKPQTVCEIGTHKANTASQIINTLAPVLEKEGKDLYYTGYDIFDEAIDNKHFNKSEFNGKNGAAFSRANRILTKLQRRYDNFSFTLIKGNTKETLKRSTFDFVYIDGGHSYETVKNDYWHVKDSKVVIFDDVNLASVRKFIDELIEQGVDVELINTPSKHIWAYIKN